MEQVPAEGADDDAQVDPQRLLPLIRHRVTRGDGAVIMFVPLVLALVYALPTAV